MTNIVALDDRRPKPQSGGNTKGTRRRFGYVRKLRSGRWHATYTAPDKSTVNGPTTFERKGDALAWLDLESAAITSGKWRPAITEEEKESPTFGAYAEEWLTRRELKPRTRIEYSRLLVALVEHFGAKPLDAISAADIREWYAKQDANRPTRRAHRYALLRTILNTAVEEELLDVNPARVRGAGKTHRAHEIKITTRDEVAAMVEALPERHKLMVTLAHGCGLRFGELTELRRKDIDLRAGTISVRRGVTWVDGKPVISTPKSAAGIRTIHVPPHLLDALERHLEQHTRPGREGLLFTAATSDSHLNHGSFRKSFDRARRAAGREDLHFHDLRHTCFVNLAIAGATTKELMTIAGHTTPAMSMKYQHVAADRMPELAARLSRLMEGIDS